MSSGSLPMETITERCAGLDVHKKTVVACALWSGPGRLTEKARREAGVLAEQD